MKDILRKISELAIRLNGATFTNEQNELQWLGNSPASMEEINLAKTRLGIELPADYIRFLLTTNGFFTPCDSTEPTFETINKVDHLKNIDTYLLEIWNEGILIDIGEQLNRAIVIGGLNDEQYFFLIPPLMFDEKWQYWKFANWIPGVQPYEDLNDYFTSVLNLMTNQSKKS